MSNDGVKFGKGDRTYSGNYGRYLKVLSLGKYCPKFSFKGNRQVSVTA